jgi:two-component system sensor histidine kinase HydH
MSPGRLVFLEIDIDEWQKRQTPLRYGIILIPLLLGVLFVAVLLLYRRNLAYRNSAEKNLRLVQLGEAARTLTHEIKNPLSAIRIQTSTLKRIIPDEYHRNLSVITEEVDRLGHLVDRVGEFLRDPVGNPERVEVGAFIRDLLRRFPAEISFSPPADAPVFISFDKPRLRTVLENLIKNAVESGSEPSGVEIHLRLESDHVEIHVLDRGNGLPEKTGDQIFDPFFTTKTQGSGIGLAVSKRFVEAAGGRLVVTPRGGGGTDAKLTLEREKA